MNKRKLTKRRKRTLLVIVLLSIISIGYAALTATLKINGEADVKARSFDVHFDNVEITKGKDTDIEQQRALIDPTDNTKVDFEVKLDNLGDEYEFTVDAVNSGDIDAMITSITPINLGEASNYLEATVTYLDGSAIEQGQGLDAGNRHTYKVNVKYRNDSDVVPPTGTNPTISMSFSVEYKKNNGTAHDPYIKLKAGDYVTLTPTSTSYTIPAGDTGYSEAQTINPSELTLWRVIDITSDGIEVVSHYLSSTDVAFGIKDITTRPTTITGEEPSVVGYRKFIKTLNTIAAQYTDGVHVKATRHMGYDSSKATEEITDKTKLISTDIPWSCSTDDEGCNAVESESLGGGDKGYKTDYNKVVGVYGEEIKGTANKFGTITVTKYWLASRRYSYLSSTRWYFIGRYVSTSGDVSSYDFYDHGSSDFYFYSNSSAIRPILTLKSDVVVSSGKGKVDNPYTLS